MSYASKLAEKSRKWVTCPVCSKPNHLTISEQKIVEIKEEWFTMRELRDWAMRQYHATLEATKQLEKVNEELRERNHKLSRHILKEVQEIESKTKTLRKQI